MRRAFEFILIKSQQLDSNFPIAEQPGSIGVEQPEQPGSSSVEQPESISVELTENIGLEQPESISVELPEQPGSISVERPESISAELTKNIGLEQPESISVELPEQPESISVEQPESLIKDSETVFILDLVSLSPQSLTSLSAPSSSTFTSVLPPHTSSCLSSSLQKRKKRTKTSTSSLPHSANSVPPPPCSQPAASSISESLNQEGPVVKKRIKGCRKCSRQKVFLFEKITGERTSEGKKELKVHWLPCTVCGRTWDDTWEPASEFQHFVPESPYPSQLSA
ncbi:hypothetical protein QQF64_025578 [Cirrhinus molitorella]|uniref:Uncharacterized protein n=1 Tax=Cirrhinus molitorella TaxID=172907 RepID=A0ABR3NQV7_9TELE